MPEMLTVTDTAMVCTDCAVVLTNGTDDDPELITHALTMDLLPRDIWIVDTSSVGVVDFSRATCETCGTTLAGERHYASIITRL